MAERSDSETMGEHLLGFPVLSNTPGNGHNGRRVITGPNGNAYVGANGTYSKVQMED